MRIMASQSLGLELGPITTSSLYWPKKVTKTGQIKGVEKQSTLKELQSYIANALVHREECLWPLF